jgi:hypothetical protein
MRTLNGYVTGTQTKNEGKIFLLYTNTRRICAVSSTAYDQKINGTYAHYIIDPSNITVDTQKYYYSDSVLTIRTSKILTNYTYQYEKLSIHGGSSFMYILVIA